MQLSLGELAQRLGAELIGDADTVIRGVNTLKDATATDVSFLANASYRRQLSDSNAGAVIVGAKEAAEVKGAALIVANPYLSFALVTQMFDNRPQPVRGVHPSVVVAASATLGADVSIAANVVIGEHCVIGDGCEIGANTVIGDHCVLGRDCLLRANVTLYHDVVLGDRVQIHSGAVIGADGFGFAPDKGRWHKIAQLGGVRIGNDVDIGANTCVDRGALADTVIEDNVILDNLIQIGHNVRLGEGSAMAANVGVAGSTTIGKHCTVSGGAGIAGHLTLADGVHVAAMTTISKSITESGAYATGTAQMPLNEWRRSATRFRQLDSMAKRLQQLEKSHEGKA
ncbi:MULTISPECIES: UDP-3-O-(3-hydroxymyristoyl)glucosamine N-acyltransferase [Oceanospirillaceae]|nr:MULTISPECIES: UDP-3-O-(3-hydroxymyristoyl)glucosamine N-acyltransferase [Thalassolituus]MCB2385060.1 UDP-3-O-(3-hydroxymyristoyl)glucosamine N-acyltransferase [Thalassolituus alkanivorans]MCB2423341.1 UDP-3-O-(3-hydroxymyristoyl)glucosamine N-acyltransferase [Thalassolituus alkanivorans]PIQ39159.1 MAG: UDP-3-O-(3-hydroxymyristoyl)glucosamine N-acyltransferase [Thalassolituus sp. CG17_big_fil_post_rev_8_21_14_2_50_53_8]TVV42025.1 UDP-3-O-(3-hydroxymyristoyl)glucosamine N-acyltransferase [Thal